MNRPISCIVLCVVCLTANARPEPGDSLKLSAATKDNLPHVLRHDRVEKRFYPHLFGTLGISTYAPHFDGLESVLRLKEAVYRAQGYTVGAGRMAVTTSPICWASIGLDFDKAIRATLDGGWTFEEDSSGRYDLRSRLRKSKILCRAGFTPVAKVDHATGESAGNVVRRRE